MNVRSVRETMVWLRNALHRFEPGAPSPLIDISQLDDADRELITQILGEGEVTIRIDDEYPTHIREGVLTGVWRTTQSDTDGNLIADYVEVAGIPGRVMRSVDNGTEIDTSVDPAHAAELMSARSILAELRAAQQALAIDGATHAVNLTMLPVSDEELAFLDERLGRGTVDIISQYYGTCRVSSTASADTWWVRYYNSTGTLILNSIETSRIPEVVVAAAEDLHDSAKRLEELLAPYWSEVA